MGREMCRWTRSAMARQNRPFVAALSSTLPPSFDSLNAKCLERAYEKVLELSRHCCR